MSLMGGKTVCGTRRSMVSRRPFDTPMDAPFSPWTWIFGEEAGLLRVAQHDVAQSTVDEAHTGHNGVFHLHVGVVKLSQYPKSSVIGPMNH